MKTPIFLSVFRTRLGQRLHISIEFGLLLAMLVAILAIRPIGEAEIENLVDQKIADQQLNLFASDIVIQALLCRRFEKDMLLNLNNRDVRERYFERWNRASLALGEAIDGFGAAAVTEADRALAKEWRSESVAYQTAMLEILRAVDRGSITTPEQANTALTSAKESIRALTGTAMNVARDKEEAAMGSSNSVGGALAGNARWIVVLGLIGLLLSTALGIRSAKR
jgi:methyl-accepting chemotaxis protein